MQLKHGLNLRIITLMKCLIFTELAGTIGHYLLDIYVLKNF